MKNKFEEILHKIVFEKNKTIVINTVIEISLLILISFSLTWVFTSLIDFQNTSKFFIMIIIKIFTALLLFYFILSNYNLRWNFKKAAIFLDKENNDKNETFLNALELADKSENYDDSILKKILENVNEKALSQKFSKTPIKNVLILFVLLISILTTYFINPKSVKVAWKWYWLSKIKIQEHEKHIELKPGNVEILRGSNLKIKIANPEENVVTTLYINKRNNISKTNFYSDTQEIFNIDSDFSYFAKTKYASSDTFYVKIFEKPIIMKITANIYYPKFTHLKPIINRETDGNFSVYKNTKISLFLKSNNELEKAKIIFSDKKEINLEQLSKLKYKVNFIVNRKIDYHFYLIDKKGFKVSNITKHINVIRDKNPRLEIISPGKDTLLTKDMKTNLKIIASDDFGLRNLSLIYQIRNNSFKKDILIGTLKNPLSFNYTLDLSKHFLLNDEEVIYWAIIYDNNKHKTVSNKFILRFPSMEEIFKEVNSQEKKSQADFKKKLKDIRKLKEEVKKKKRDLARKEQLDWQDKKDIKNFLNKQKEANEEIKKMAEDYQKIIRNLEKNNAVSKELLEKMKKIKELMDEISDKKLKDAMDELQKSMNSISPEMMKKALKNFETSLEEYEKKIDETLKLLEKIKKEEALNKTQKMLEEARKQQEDLLKKTENPSKNKDNLSKEQKSIQDKMDKIKKQIKDMNEMLKDDDKLSKMAEELKKMAENDSLQKSMEKSQSQLSMSKMKDASKYQKSTLQQMKKMARMIKKMQNMMGAGQQAEMSKLVDDTIKRLFILAKLEENSRDKFSGNPFEILSEQIACSEALKITVNQLFTQPMIIMMINPKFLYDYNSLQKSFQNLFKQINDNKLNKLNEKFKAISKNFNLMIYDLLQSNSNSQGGGGGMESLMKQLKNMGQQQMMMNMLTQQLMEQLSENGKQRLSNKTLSQIRRLASDENQLAKNLERVLQTNNAAQKQTYSLQKIIDDLKEISKQIRNNRLNEELVEKQNRIISRLLDVEKSIHTREFSKKRKSETAKQKLWDLKNIKNQDYKDISNAIFEENMNKFTPKQQAIIRKYLNKLNEMQNNFGEDNE